MLDRLLIALALIMAFGLFALLVNRYQRRQATGAAKHDRSAREAGAEELCPRVLYFRSDQCVSCEAQARLWTQLDEGVRGLIETVDVNDEPERARAYGVLTLPTSLVIGLDDRVMTINYGVVSPRKLMDQLEAALHGSGPAEKTAVTPGPVCELFDAA